MLRWLRRRRQRRDLAARTVWLFGSPRSGSTWLHSLLCAHPLAHGINEPLLGLHLGATTDQVIRRQDDAAPDRIIDVSRERPDYVFADPWRSTWTGPLRQLVLDRYAAQLAADRAPRGCVVVFKEPHGSEAADLLSELMPESRLLLLVRDGRDVVDSELDAIRPGGWGTGTSGAADGSREQRLATIREQSHRWVIRMEAVLRAQQRHPEERVHLVRYERVLSETTTELQSILHWLDLPVPEDLAAVVSRFAFEQIPPERRGPGQFARAATPGLWRESFDEEEQALLHDLMGPVLSQLGYPT